MDTTYLYNTNCSNEHFDMVDLHTKEDTCCPPYSSDFWSENPNHILRNTYSSSPIVSTLICLYNNNIILVVGVCTSLYMPMIHFLLSIYSMRTDEIMFTVI